MTEKQKNSDLKLKQGGQSVAFAVSTYLPSQWWPLRSGVMVEVIEKLLEGADEEKKRTIMKIIRAVVR